MFHLHSLSVLLPRQAQQLYHTESLYLLGRPITVAVPRANKTETLSRNMIHPFCLQCTSTSHSWSRAEECICGSYSRRCACYFWPAQFREACCYSWSIIYWSVHSAFCQVHFVILRRYVLILERHVNGNRYEVVHRNM